MNNKELKPLKFINVVLVLEGKTVYALVIGKQIISGDTKIECVINSIKSQPYFEAKRK